MKFSDFLKSRQSGLSTDIFIDNKTIFFNDIHTTLDITGWSFLDTQKFDDFISTYTFPENEELSKSDRNGIRNNIPSPQILIRKEKIYNLESNAVIAVYLYEKEHLTGGSMLHVRSINKLEQQWLQFLITLKMEGRNNPKVNRAKFFEYSQSADKFFSYTLSNNQRLTEGRLRLLTFDFGSHVLMMYVFDTGDLHQEELSAFLNNMRYSG